MALAAGSQSPTASTAAGALRHVLATACGTAQQVNSSAAGIESIGTPGSRSAGFFAALSSAASTSGGHVSLTSHAWSGSWGRNT